MKNRISTFIILIFTCVLLTVSVSAQGEASTWNGKPSQEEPLPKPILENLKKVEFEQLKKDYEEMLANGEEAVKLSEEVESSYSKSSKLTGSDKMKLEKIEKLLKKIRKELGGDADVEETVQEKPTNIGSAVTTLKETAKNLFDELKKTSRYSISVVAIQSSNTMLDIVRFLKFWKK